MPLNYLTTWLSALFTKTGCHQGPVGTLCRMSADIMYCFRGETFPCVQHSWGFFHFLTALWLLTMKDNIVSCLISHDLTGVIVGRCLARLAAGAPVTKNVRPFRVLTWNHMSLYYQTLTVSVMLLTHFPLLFVNGLWLHKYKATPSLKGGYFPVH